MVGYKGSMLTSNTLQVNWGNGAPLNNHGILIRVDKTTVHKNIKKENSSPSYGK